MGSEVKLTKSDLDGMATSADDVADDINAAGDALSGGESPDIKGFETLGALRDVAERWKDDKVSKSADKWTTHADNLRATADHVVATDKSNEWHVQDAAN